MQNKQVSRLLTSAATRIGRLCEHPRRLLPAQRMRVLIVPDKFKGTLTAAQAARAIAAGWRKVRPGDQVETLPASDGGDGFGAVMSRLLGAKSVLCQTIDAAHRRHKALWWWDAGTRTAIIETANLIG